MAKDAEDFPRENIFLLYKEMNPNNKLRFDPEMRGRIGHPANRLSLNPKLLTRRFCCTLWDNGLPPVSPIGERQYYGKIGKLLGNPLEINLWFVDQFCIRGPHYVTLVVTKRGSDIDRWV